MAKQFAKAFYKSKAWQQCRESYIASVFGLCERCRKAGYIVHHKIVLTPENINDQSVTLNHENLCYVCKSCHEKEHGTSGEVTREDLFFDAAGDLVKK